MIYKDTIIELNLNGLYSAFIFNVGYVKADTIEGIKKLIVQRG